MEKMKLGEEDNEATFDAAIERREYLRHLLRARKGKITEEDDKEFKRRFPFLKLGEAVKKMSVPRTRAWPEFYRPDHSLILSHPQDMECKRPSMCYQCRRMSEIGAQILEEFETGKKNTEKLMGTLLSEELHQAEPSHGVESETDD